MAEKLTRTIRAPRDQILVRADVPTDKVGKLGLLYAPQGEEKWPNTGTIIDIGPGRFDSEGKRVDTPLDVKIGDRIIFKREPDSAIVPDIRDGDPYGEQGLVMLNPASVLFAIEDETSGALEVVYERQA